MDTSSSATTSNPPGAALAPSEGSQPAAQSAASSTDQHAAPAAAHQPAGVCRSCYSHAHSSCDLPAAERHCKLCQKQGHTSFACPQYRSRWVPLPKPPAARAVNPRPLYLAASQRGISWSSIAAGSPAATHPPPPPPAAVPLQSHAHFPAPVAGTQGPVQPSPVHSQPAQLAGLATGPADTAEHPRPRQLHGPDDGSVQRCAHQCRGLPRGRERKAHGRRHLHPDHSAPRSRSRPQAAAPRPLPPVTTHSVASNASNGQHHPATRRDHPGGPAAPRTGSAVRRTYRADAADPLHAAQQRLHQLQPSPRAPPIIGHHHPPLSQLACCQLLFRPTTNHERADYGPVHAAVPERPVAHSLPPQRLAEARPRPGRLSCPTSPLLYVFVESGRLEPRHGMPGWLCSHHPGPEQGGGGGITLLYHTSCPVSPLPEHTVPFAPQAHPYASRSTAMVWHLVRPTGRAAFLLAAVYLPPHNAPKQYYMRQILHSLDTVPPQYQLPVLVVGDFNLRHPAWHQPPSGSLTGPAARLADWLYDNDYHVANQPGQFTHRTKTSTSIIDLILASDPDLVSSMSTAANSAAVLLSDHPAHHGHHGAEQLSPAARPATIAAAARLGPPHCAGGLEGGPARRALARPAAAPATPRPAGRRRLPVQPGSPAAAPSPPDAAAAARLRLRGVRGDAR